MTHRGILLCVDDEMMVLTALRNQLRRAFDDAHLVEIAESAEEGLEILDELSGEGYIPLVIISDWLMPGMKGDEFLIKAHQRFPHVIKIMLSGQADEAAILRSRELANLHEFIAKPWDAQVLIASIQAGLEDFWRENPAS